MSISARLARLEANLELQDDECSEIELDLPRGVYERYLASRAAGTFPEGMAREDLLAIAFAPVLSGDEFE